MFDAILENIFVKFYVEKNKYTQLLLLSINAVTIFKTLWSIKFIVNKKLMMLMATYSKRGLDVKRMLEI